MQEKANIEQRLLHRFSYHFFLSLILIICLGAVILAVMTIVRNNQLSRTSGLLIRYLDSGDNQQANVYKINEVRDSKQEGVAYLESIANKTEIFVNIAGTELPNQPVNIYSGNCDDLGNIITELSSLNNGISKTIVPQTLADLTNQDLAVVVHKSAEDANTLVACGNLKQ